MNYSRKVIESIRKQKENPTPAELLMMEKLSFRNIQFRFIHPVVLESQFFTADFYIPKYGLIIEIDGGIHNRCDQKWRDTVKDVVYESLGYNVLRIKNSDVDTFDTLSVTRYQKRKITPNVQQQQTYRKNGKGRTSKRSKTKQSKNRMAFVPADDCD